MRERKLKLRLAQLQTLARLGKLANKQQQSAQLRLKQLTKTSKSSQNCCLGGGFVWAWADCRLGVKGCQVVLPTVFRKEHSIT
mgnify:CR=1 FL=1